MAIFSNKVNKAAISPAPTVKAAAAGGYTPNLQGPNMIGQYYTYQEGELRNRAMQIPAVSRARDLHASVISAMGLKMYRERWNETEREMEDEYIAPRSWLRRPDPAIPMKHSWRGRLMTCSFLGVHFGTSPAEHRTATPHRLPAAT